MDHIHRVSKDTSACKSTKQLGTHTAMEFAAMKASHEAYTSTMTQGYECRLVDVEVEHEKEISELKAAHDRESSAAFERQAAVVEEAVKKASEQWVSERNGLMIDIASLIDENKSLGIEVENIKKDREAVKDKALVLYTNEVVQLETLKVAHAEEVKELKRQIWIEVSLKSKGRKTVEYLQRPRTRFREVAQQLCETKNISFPLVHWEAKGVEIKDVAKTLFQLGIQDGDEIWYRLKNAKA